MPAFQDLTGRVFGRLTVLCRDENRKNKVYWLCRCFHDDGTFVDVVCQGDALRSGNTKSCGCIVLQQAVRVGAARLKNYPGQIYGGLTLTGRAEPAPSGGTRWWCSCVCEPNNPQKIAVSQTDLERGKDQCGCLTFVRRHQVWSEPRQLEFYEKVVGHPEASVFMDYIDGYHASLDDVFGHLKLAA